MFRVLSITSIVLNLVSFGFVVFVWNRNEFLAFENAALKGAIAGYQEEMILLKNRLKIEGCGDGS